MSQQAWAIEAAEVLQEVASWLDQGKPLEDRSLTESAKLYLLASHLYYDHDVSMMQDASYDRLCRFLLENFRWLESAGVWNRELFDAEALEAGTGHHLAGRYPMAIQQIADVIAARHGATRRKG